MAEEKTDIVRIRAELIPLIDDVVDNEKDEYGIERYHSRKDVVSQAVKEFLDRIKEANKK